MNTHRIPARHVRPFTASRAPLASLLVVTMVATMLPLRTARADAAAPAGPAPTTTENAAGLGSLDGPAGSHDAVASASVDPSTGALRAAFPIKLPDARGSVQPSLALVYNSSATGATGIGGRGWSLTTPAIERHNLSGPPTFADPPTGGRIDPTKQDRFTWNGIPLVPICFVDDGDAACRPGAAKGSTETMPAWTKTGGWHYYRPETGDLHRFFWSPDHRLWRVQSPSGATTEYGVPSDNPQDTSGVDADSITTSQIYRWNIVRQWDSQRSPTGGHINQTVYQWSVQDDPSQRTGPQLGLLRDIYDTPPLTDSPNPSEYAHHVHLAYLGPQVAWSQTSVWRATPHFLLSRVDVSSTPFSGGVREQIRRYYFNYDFDAPFSASARLTSVLEEGACAEGSNNLEQNGLLPEPGANAQVCPQKPLVKIGYSASAIQPSFTSIGAPVPTWPALPQLASMPGGGLTPGWLGTAMATPRALPSLMDINGDGLLDFVGPPADAQATSQPVALNTGDPNRWTSSTISFVSSGVYGAAPSTMTPTNKAYSVGNYVGNGSFNVLFQGPAPTASGTQDVPYALYSPAKPASSSTWLWNGGAAATFRLDAPVYQALPAHNDKAPEVSPYLRCPARFAQGELELGGEKKYATVDIDGDGYSDQLTSRSVLGWACGGPNQSGAPIPAGFCHYDYDCDLLGCHKTEYYACEQDIAQFRRLAVYTTSRASDGTISPFGNHSAPLCIGGANSAPEQALLALPHSPPTSASDFADVNGDGLADYVQLGPTDVRVWLGHGDGDFGICHNGQFSCPPDDHYAKDNRWPQPRDTYFLTPQPSTSALPSCSDAAPTESLPWTVMPDSPSALASGHIHDVNGDGFGDLVVPNGSSLDVYLNNGNWFAIKSSIDLTQQGWDASTLNQQSTDPTSQGPVVMFGDLNGNGTDDIIVMNSAGQLAYIDMLGGAKPNLVTDIDNGIGVKTHIDYATTAELDLASQALGSPWAWTTHSPELVKVVTAITTTGNASPNDVYRNEYEYTNPTYDPRDRAFIGFQWVAALQRLDDGSKRFKATRFYQGHCGDDVLSGGTCVGSNDYSLAAFRGLPIITEVGTLSPGLRFSDSGKGILAYLSTLHRSFGSVDLLSGMDGRVVRRVVEARTDAYAYDADPFIASPTNGTVSDIQSATLNVSAPYTIRAAADHLVRINNPDPISGLISFSRDLGRVDANGNTLDGEIQHAQDVRVIPQDTTEFWTLRPMSASTTGTVPAGAATGFGRYSRSDYDAHGNRLHSYASLAGTRDLQRSHATGLAFAPPPSDGLFLPSGQYQEITTATLSYRPEGTGLLARAEAPGGRCTDYNYDPFHQFVMTSTAYLNGCGQPGMITTTRSKWRRGFGLNQIETDATGAMTQKEYDGFGRLTKVWRPDPISGALGSDPSATITYIDVPDGPAQAVHTRTMNGQGGTVESWSFLDGFGRPIAGLEQADPTLDDGYPWILSGQVVRDGRGNITSAYPPRYYYAVDPQDNANAVRATVQSFFLNGPSYVATYDAFGRKTATFSLDGTQTSQHRFHGLTEQVYDGEEVGTGGHFGAYTKLSHDGHGRLYETTQYAANHTYVTTHSDLLPTGEVSKITRSGLDAHGLFSYARWMEYDSFGHLVQNAEPNTSVGFDPSGATSSLKTWRYAYNANGELVGTSDARGCGENLAYDALGRLVSEDYSPCLPSQAAYSKPTSASGPDNYEAFYRYDFDDSASTTGAGDGRLHEISDRAANTTFHVDARGRAIATERQIAKPGAPDPVRANRYAAHVFRATTQYDDLDRVVAQSTGADVDALKAQTTLHPEGESNTYFDYSARGTVKSIRSSYGTLVTQATFAPDGLPTSIQYGDGAHTAADFVYDAQRRLMLSHVWRTSVAPLDLEDTRVDAASDPDHLGYDRAGNPLAIHDNRVASEWPDGAKPVSRTLATYDDQYRLKAISYSYATTSSGDRWTDPAIPGEPPRVDSTAARVRLQHFDYSGLGDITLAADDTGGHYERALGTIQLGSSTQGPNQLVSSNADTGGTGVDATWDAAGNLASLVVSSNTIRVMPSSVYQYDWDEVGRLSRAARRDVKLGSIPPLADVELHYAYDAGGARVLKSWTTDGGTSAYGGNTLSTSAEVFRSLRVNHATFDIARNDYDVSATTETAYLAGGLARVLYVQSDPVLQISGGQHVFLELGGHLGSTSTILDFATGELVEKLTYLAYGGVDSDYRPQKWASFHEDYKFTGKEDDTEVGLTYFGARYYAPALMRFVSADPLTIHGASGDLNPYAYVAGRALAAVDPSGLDGEPYYGGSFSGAGYGGPYSGSWRSYGSGDYGNNEDGYSVDFKYNDEGNEIQPDGQKSDWLAQYMQQSALPGWITEFMAHAMNEVGPSDEAEQTGSYFRDDIGRTEKWNPYGTSADDAMLLGSGRDLTLRETDPQTYYALNLLGTMALYATPVLGSLATLADSRSSGFEKGIAWASLALPALKAATAFKGMAFAAGTMRAAGTAEEAPALLSQFTTSTVEDVTASSGRLRAGGQISEGARAIAKKLGHAQSGGYPSAFAGIRPTQANAEGLIRGVLQNPARTFYGNSVIDVYNAAGQGVRFDRATSAFIGFLEEGLATQ